MSPPSNASNGIQQKLDFTFFDTQTIATGAVAATFFANTAGATAQNSNFPTNGQLPSGQRFVARTLQVFVFPLNGATAMTIRDVLEVGIGRMDLFLNTVPMFEGHPIDCPAGMGLQVDLTALTSAINNGMPMTGNVRRLDPPIYIRGQRVSVQMSFNPAITLATSAIVRVLMAGTLYRDAS